MGLNMDPTKKAGDKKDAGAKAVAKAAPEVEEVLLTMSVYKRSPMRHVYQGHLYESGVVYAFEPAAARIMLRLQSDAGVPIFIRYEKPVSKRRVEDDVAQGPRIVTAPKPVDEVADLGLQPVPRRHRIDAGTEDELPPEFRGGEGMGGDMTSADIAESGTKV
jgi:hypothetical protein